VALAGNEVETCGCYDGGWVRLTGSSWIRLTGRMAVTPEAWMLTDGQEVGLGRLLEEID
jgi:hypothetical protein